HGDVQTVWGTGMDAYRQTPALDDTGELTWQDVGDSGNTHILRPASEPFSPDGGLRILTGNLGRAVIKISAVVREHHVVEAPAVIFHNQQDVIDAFKRGELDRDCVVVVRFQGPRAIGMPELHKLSPTLALIQERGHHVALITDGRMSGASGKVPSAIHVTPEAETGGPLARLRDGDIVRLDATAGTLEARVDAAEWNAREAATCDLAAHQQGCGRELFTRFRDVAGPADAGASVFAFADSAVTKAADDNHRGLTSKPENTVRLA
ncbi:MAG TPA: dihydroxy-acid dehydratase, partial [Oleiagrimonas sp.]|nr:dihydroxy-acid dehydratase [Oleiagrimonas sp.]